MEGQEGKGSDGTAGYVCNATGWWSTSGRAKTTPVGKGWKTVPFCRRRCGSGCTGSSRTARCSWNSDVNIQRGLVMLNQFGKNS